ncbi:hypothetical protein RZS08_11465, partial [Arthrospira platensis SPKY1]|nr:hypothetical protein [Arthrospira platensis SPKY1]
MRIAPAVGWRLIPLVRLVVPSHPCFDLGEVRVDATDLDRADRSPVAVRLWAVGDHLFVENEPGQVLAGAVTERLPALRRVDPGKAELVLLQVGVEQGHGIAVGDRDDAAGEGGCSRAVRADEHNGRDRQGRGWLHAHGCVILRRYRCSSAMVHWTVRRRLSNVARGAAEGLEGPAGTERLDPTPMRS